MNTLDLLLMPKTAQAILTADWKWSMWLMQQSILELIVAENRKLEREAERLRSLPPRDAYPRLAELRRSHRERLREIMAMDPFIYAVEPPIYLGPASKGPI